MSRDIHLAFAHPAERSHATAEVGLADRISLRDHIVEVEIGAFQAERGTTQRVCFNVVVEVARPARELDDDVDRILSYDKVTEAIAHELEVERVNLLETLAERIAARILHEPQAVRVFIRIEKLDRGPGALGVEIVRARHEAAPTEPEDEDMPHPQVIFLSPEAVASPRLSGWLDGLEAAGQPVIVCVGRAEGPVLQAGHPAAQRRIDLLAIEQAAWVLAARDPRCVVVASRTELDWAMRRGQISVWAPSKIVLDATHGPGRVLESDAALAGWFADHVEANGVSFVGVPVPTGVTRARALPLEVEALT